MYYKFNEEMINRKYTIKLCSLEKKYIYYRDNFKRLCIDNYKLQKENENLKTDYQILQDDLKEHNIIYTDTPEFEEKYISKDKIKEALGDKNIPDEIILTYIETLVTENNRLEDIEDRKVQIEYNNVFNKGIKSVEGKIRTKIKELEEQQAIEIEETGMSLLSVPIRILKELLGDDE